MAISAAISADVLADLELTNPATLVALVSAIDLEGLGAREIGALASINRYIPTYPALWYCSN
jgi:hypothetical protein